MSGLLGFGTGTHDVAGHALNLGAHRKRCLGSVSSSRSTDGPFRCPTLDPRCGKKRHRCGRCFCGDDVACPSRCIAGFASDARSFRSQSCGPRGVDGASDAAPSRARCCRCLPWGNGPASRCSTARTRGMGSAFVHRKSARTAVSCKSTIHVGDQRHRCASVHHDEVASPAWSDRSRGCGAHACLGAGDGDGPHAPSHRTHRC